ncbi:MAG: DEAD/DEAH box helicase [Jatrophihabitans sp.]|uniref:DEAD/DEAH box helicase n=1 Tax=Jatrophihabitans sp. TaxID=1932789 RepID=UPI003F7EFDF1
MAEPRRETASPTSPISVTAPRLRAWQQAALTAYDEAGARDFLVTATPGSGKTTFALALARMLLERRVVERVVVVCPTDHLRTQWAEAADRAGIPLDAALTNAVGPVRADLRGYVTTYAQVAAKPALHEARVTAKRTLVVLDEVHHAGDGLSWGEAVAIAFERAARRVCLTGTPFRTRPDERIPFVRYDPDGEGGWRSSADFSYGYRQALADGVVRPVVFAAYTGTTHWRNSAGEVVAASLSEISTKSTEATAWRTALDPRGQWVPHVIAAMDERITHLRESGFADAAGLVLASDQEDARAYAEIAERVTGETPTVILSDDPKAGEKIAAFTVGTQRLAVCVRMVSEGVDVPRAMCLAWLTSYRTPLFFAQGVGRVVRARSHTEAATVFLPAVRPLLTLAAELEEERNHVIPPPPSAGNDQLEVLDVVPPEREPGKSTKTELVDAEAAFAHVLHGGRAVIAQPQLTDDDEAFLGLPGILSPEQTAAVLARRDAVARKRAVEPTTVTPSAETARWRAGAELRKEVNRLVAVLAARQGVPHRQVHAELRRAVPGPASAAADVDLLERRRDHLMALVGG